MLMIVAILFLGFLYRMAVEGTHSQTLFLVPDGDVGDDVGVGWQCCKVQVMVAMLVMVSW